MTKLCVSAFVPDQTYPGAKAFLENVRAFKIHHPLLLCSHEDYGPGIERLKGSPLKFKDAKYPNDKPNPWAVNTIVFLSCVRMALAKGFTHILYLEADCRMKGDYWDKTIADEFFLAGEGKLMGGSVVAYNAFNRSLAFSLRWRDFIVRNANSPFPIPCYGGNGAAETYEPAIFVNGAGAIYDLSFIGSIYNLEQTGKEAAQTTAFDYHAGRDLVRKYGDDATAYVAHLSSMYSGYGNVHFTEEQRRELLDTGKVCLIHQIKSDWQPSYEHISTQTEPATVPPADTDGAGILQDSLSLNTNTESVDSQNTSPKVTILIVTHAKDIPWLKYCLKSIDMFAEGFTRTIVVAPKQEEAQFGPMIAKCRNVTVLYADEPAPPYGHLNMLMLKSMADTFDHEADYFVHMDADCIFHRPTRPADLFQDGKPILLVESWKSILRNKRTEKCWREPTDKALGFATTQETMRRLPMVFHRSTYPAMRKHVETLHKRSFERYVMTQQPKFPFGFCEFNALGSYALKYQPDRYHVIPVEDGQNHPPNPVLQLWSHGAMDHPQPVWLEGQMITYIPNKILTQILG